MANVKLGVRVENPHGGWSCKAEVDGRVYSVTLSRGSRVRVAFRPRDFVGFKWYGRVADERGRELWRDRVNKSNGVQWMLRAAGVLADYVDPAERQRANRRALEARTGLRPRNVGGEGPDVPSHLWRRYDYCTGEWKDHD